MAKSYEVSQSQLEEKAERGERVDIKEIAAAYQKAVPHKVSDTQIYCVLHRHGWREIMPRSKHPKKASVETIESSKKDERDRSSNERIRWVQSTLDVSG